MLSSIKNIYYQIKTISNTDKYRILIFILILTSIFNSFNIKRGITYEAAILSFMSTTLFLFLVIGSVFVSTLFVVYSIDKNPSYLIRFKAKKNYLINLLILVTIMNFITYITAITFGLIILTLKYFGNIELSYLSYYNIPYIIYNIFTIFKYFIIINMLSLIGVILFKGTSRKFGHIFYILILIFYFSSSLPASVITEFDLENLLFNYYLYPLQYSSFFTEINFFIIELCFLIIILEMSLLYIVRFNKIKIND